MTRLSGTDLAQLRPEAVDQRVALQTSIDDAALELAHLHLEIQKRRWLVDPVAWARERLGEHPWSKQREILNAVRDRRRVAVRSCHEIGKSWTAAVVVCWWIDVHPPGHAFVVTSAPSAMQVRSILWREIGRLHTKGNLPGRLNTTEWKVPVAVPVKNSIGRQEFGTREELVAFGRKPDDHDPTAFQGIHAPRVLIVWDEACGIPLSLWEAGDSLIANDTGKALAIGNPDDPNAEFARVCTPGSGWHTIGVSAFETPNFTGEEVEEIVASQLVGKRYVEEKRKKWAPRWRWNKAQTQVLPPSELVDEPTEQEFFEGLKDTNPLWQSKIMGRFPHISSTGGLIPLMWIQAAQARELQPGPTHYLGLDVGGGGDSSVCAERRGPVVRVLWENQNPNTMAVLGESVASLEKTGALRVNVDGVGIGRGVVDRAVEQELPYISIGTAEEPEDPEHFVNRRAELWWNVRELFEHGLIDIDPADEDLAAELCSIHFERLSSGKIQIETKRDAKRRGVPSPNRADAVMMAFAEPAKVEQKYVAVRALW